MSRGNSNNNRGRGNDSYGRFQPPQQQNFQPFPYLLEPPMNMLNFPLRRSNSDSSIATSRGAANSISLLTKYSYHNFDVAFEGTPLVARCFIVDAPATDVSMKRAVRTIWVDEKGDIAYTHKDSFQYIRSIALIRKNKRITRLEAKIIKKAEEDYVGALQKTLERIKKVPSYTAAYFETLVNIAKNFKFRKPS
nr:TPA_asm: hypothetical protein [Mediterra virus]